MLKQKTHASSGAAHGKRAGPHTLPRRSALRPIDQDVWSPAKQLADASAALIAVGIFSYAPSAYAFHDASHASKQPVAALERQACGAAATPVPLAELSAGLFGGGGDVPEERDPITPFTLYGTSFKKYLIEQLQGEKIISRKKGFTVNACVGAVDVNQETPQFQGLPTGDKALYAKNRVCRKSEGQDLKDTCRSACEAACGEALDSYAAQVTQESGFALAATDTARMGKSCARNCSYECGKPGKAFDFVIPYRR